MPWGVDLAWIIDSCQPIIFCAKLGLGPQIATQQLGCWESSPCTWLSSLQPSAGTPPPKRGALLWEGKGAKPVTSPWWVGGNTLVHSAPPQLDNGGLAFHCIDLGILIRESFTPVLEMRQDHKWKGLRISAKSRKQSSFRGLTHVAPVLAALALNVH